MRHTDGSQGSAYIKQLLIIIFILIAAEVGLWLWTKTKNPVMKIRDDSELSRILSENQENSREALHSLSLFFSLKDQSLLSIEAREIEKQEAGVHHEIRQAIQELIKGPDDNENFIRTIPMNTKLRGLYLEEKNGTAYLDFSDELRKDHPGGSWAEALTVYSIVNTLTYNFPQVRKIKLLINGQTMETLAGHLDLDRSFSYSEHIVKPSIPGREDEPMNFDPK
jgi:germination protein M